MRQTPPVLCSLSSATCCMTNVLLSGVVPRSPGTCTGFYLARRMLKVKSRQGEQPVLLNLKEQRDAGQFRPKNRNFGKRRGWINRIRYGHNSTQAEEEREGPGKQMDGCVRKRNKTTVCVHVHAAAHVGTPPGAAVSGEHRGGGLGGQGE